MREELKWIPGYEGMYKVSNHGYVCSVDREVITKTGQKRKYKGVKLKPIKYTKEKSSYYDFNVVSLSKERKVKQYRIHSLVYKIFNNIEKLPIDKETYFLDGDRTNCNLNNLQLVLKGASRRSKVCLGIDTFTKGDIQFIRYNPFKLTQDKLRKIFNTSRAIVDQIQREITYKPIREYIDMLDWNEVIEEIATGGSLEGGDNQ